MSFDYGWWVLVFPVLITLSLL